MSYDSIRTMSYNSYKVNSQSISTLYTIIFNFWGFGQVFIIITMSLFKLIQTGKVRSLYICSVPSVGKYFSHWHPDVLHFSSLVEKLLPLLNWMLRTKINITSTVISYLSYNTTSLQCCHQIRWLYGSFTQCYCTCPCLESVQSLATPQSTQVRFTLSTDPPSIRRPLCMAAQCVSMNQWVWLALPALRSTLCWRLCHSLLRPSFVATPSSSYLVKSTHSQLPISTRYAVINYLPCVINVKITF